MSRPIGNLHEPLEIPPFDHALHIAPVALFDRLRAGTPPLILDLRVGRPTLRLRGAVHWTPTTWPFGTVEAVLIDDDGAQATQITRALHDGGHNTVRALYGGLRLLDFTLHPAEIRGDRYVSNGMSPGTP